MKGFNYIHTVLFVLCFALTGNTGLAQKESMEPSDHPLFYVQKDFLPVRKIDHSFKNRANINLMAGTSFWSVGKRNNGFISYLRPEIDYSIAPRFHVISGIVIVNHQIPGYKENDPLILSHPPGNRIFMYAEGEYLVNEKLSVFGSVAKEITSYKPHVMNPAVYNMDYHNASVGINYRITDNFNFGAHVNVREGYNPYLDIYRMNRYREAPFFSPVSW